MYDIGIHCGYLLPMVQGNTQVLQDQFLAIKQDKIVAIKPWHDADKQQATQFIDASQQLVMPGLINGHTHLPMNLLRGLAEDQPFWQWLHGTILPIEKQFVSPEFVRIGTELAVLELVQAGVTTVCDMFYFEDTVAEVIDKTGLRALLGQTIADFPCPDDPKGNGAAYQILTGMVERYGNHPRITPCIAPHAPYSCSDTTLQKVRQQAERLAVPIMTHVAETREEVLQSLKQYQMSPVERLHRLGLMEGNSIFAHCVHVTEADIELIAETHTSVVHNPNSNMKLSCGIAPLRQLLAQQVNVGIGTDGAASNNSLSIFHEIGVGMKLQKLHDADTSLTSKDLLNMATFQGAKVLGLAEQTGSLAVGKQADCIVVDIDLPHWQPLYDIPAALVYSAQGFEVATTICQGRILMKNRQVQTIDTAQLNEEMRELSTAIHHYTMTKA